MKRDLYDALKPEAQAKMTRTEWRQQKADEQCAAEDHRPRRLSALASDETPETCRCGMYRWTREQTR